MTDLEDVTQRLEELKRSSRSDIPTHLSPALRRFRFIPRAERRACADEFFAWANGEGAEPVLLGYAVFVQGMDRFIAEELRDSLALVTKARAIFAEHNERDGLGLCAMLIGATYRTFGNFDLAMKVLVEGDELLRASGRYPIFVAANANSMANIHLETGNLEEALAKFTLTFDESARADDFYFKIYGLQGLARVHARQGRHDDANYMHERALALSEQHGHPLHISNSLTELAAFHQQAGDLDSAEALTKRALVMREDHRLLAGAVTSGLRLAELRAKRGRYDDARQLLERTLKVAEELGVKPKIAQVHEALSSLFEQTHDTERSLAHYKKFHALRDEIEREDNARSLADARAIFEAEQTRKENAIIRQQKVEIEQKNIELQDTIDELTRAKIGRKAKAFTLAIAVVLFIFQDAILGTALKLLASDNYFLLLAVKMAIIFSLAPINRSIEHHLLKRVTRKGKGKSSPSPVTVA